MSTYFMLSIEKQKIWVSTLHDTSVLIIHATLPLINEFAEVSSKDRSEFRYEYSSTFILCLINASSELSCTGPYKVKYSPLHSRLTNLHQPLFPLHLKVYSNIKAGSSV